MIELVNKSGKIVGQNPDTGETVPIDLGALSPDSVQPANGLGVPTYSSDGDAPNSTLYINSGVSELRFKDSDGNVRHATAAQHGSEAHSSSVVHDGDSIQSLQAANDLGIPTYSTDGDAPNETLFLHTGVNALRYKDGTGNVRPATPDTHGSEAHTDSVVHDGDDASLGAVSTEQTVTDEQRVREVDYGFDNQVLAQGSYIGLAQEMNFEDPVNDWSTTNSSVSKSTSDVFRGAAAAKMTGAAADSEKLLTYFFSTTKDLTGLNPSVAVRIAQPSAQNSVIRVRLFDGSNNQFIYNSKINPAKAGGANEWIRVEPSPAVEDSGFDVSAVDRVRVSQSVTEDTEIYIDDLRWIPRPDKGYVILWFDDALESHYTKAFDTLDKYGLVGACAVNSELIGDSGKLTKTQMAEMQAAGWDMCNHTANGFSLPGQSKTDQREQIKSGKEWLQDNGFKKAADIVAYPNNEYDQTTLELMREYGLMGFAGEGPNPQHANSPFYTTWPFGVRRAPGDTNKSNVDLSSVKTAIDFATNHNQVANISFHGIDTSDGVAQSDLDNICSHIDGKGSNIQVLTPSNWRDALLVQ